jgi:colanic acid biosynthesis glycosyl transferase WcaI
MIARSVGGNASGEYLRILVVSQYFWPENFRVNDLVEELLRRGHAVTVLTGKPNYPEGEVFEDFRRRPAHYSNYRGAEVVRIPVVARGHRSLTLLLNYVTYALSGATAGAWRLRGRPVDVIFVYEPSPVTVGIPAVVLGRLKRAPVIFWVLDLWPQTLEALGVVRSKAALAGIGILVRFIYNRCARVLGQSSGFVPEIRRYCRPDVPVSYFPSWAEPMFVAQAAPRAPEVPANPECLTILFAGNIGDAQDFPNILEAATLLRDDPRIRWIIVGDGRLADWVRSEVARRKLADRFFLLGRFPIERMPSFYSCADVLLVTLQRKRIFSMTIPGKLQTYLAAGLPILAALDGEGADVIRRWGAGVACEPGDPQALAAAARDLASRPANVRAAMGSQAALASETEFSRDALISQLEQWARDSIGGRR